MKNGKTNFLAFQQNKYKKYFSVFCKEEVLNDLAKGSLEFSNANG